MLVLDANILIRAVLGRRVRQLIEEYAPRGIRFYAPEIAHADAAKYLPSLLAKIGKSDAELAATLDYLRIVVTPVEEALYWNLESEARERLSGRDEQDWPILACALALSSSIWTEDTDFFGTGASIWTTNRVEIFLKAQAGGR